MRTFLRMTVKHGDGMSFVRQRDIRSQERHVRELSAKFKESGLATDELAVEQARNALEDMHKRYTEYEAMYSR
jgi:hypothetical protein